MQHIYIMIYINVRIINALGTRTDRVDGEYAIWSGAALYAPTHIVGLYIL